MKDLFRQSNPRIGESKTFFIIGILLIFIVLIFLLSGCITTKKRLCPSENIVYYIFTPFGPAPVVIEKDFFNEKNKGGRWMTEEEFDKLMEGRPTPEEENKGEFTPQESNFLELHTFMDDLAERLGNWRE